MAFVDKGGARNVVGDGEVVLKVILCGDNLRLGESHDGGDGLEAADAEVVDAVDHVGIGEAATDAFASEVDEKVVFFDEPAERRAGEAFAVAAHELGGVDAREERGLSCGGLGKAGRAEACVDGHRVVGDEVAEVRADAGVDRIVWGWGTKAKAVDE